MISRLTIRGMRSVHCTRAVFTSLAAVEGVATAEVSIGRATVEHDGRATAAALTEAVAVAGYELVEVKEERRRLRVV